MPDWLKVVNSTIPDYIRKEVDGTTRQRAVLAMAEKRGKIKLSCSGTEMDWKVEYKEKPIKPYSGGTTISFEQIERYVTAKLGWRGYIASDGIDKMTVEQNKSVAAIINLFNDMVPKLIKDMRNGFSQEMYGDGNASGREQCIHGFESWFSVSGAALDGYVGVPNDTYATIRTQPGVYGGSWDTNGGNSTWPRGKGTVTYDFWSPLIVDYTDTAWAGATATWASNCQKALRFAITHQVRVGGREEGIDFFLIDAEMMRQLKDFQSEKERIIVSNGDLAKMGFKDVMMLDGVEILTEFGVPQGVGYGIPISTLSICSLQNTLFKTDDVEWSQETRSYRAAIDFLGNMKITSPRSWVKLAAIS
jgi:hypothetical protein